MFLLRFFACVLFLVANFCHAEKSTRYSQLGRPECTGKLSNVLGKFAEDHPIKTIIAYQGLTFTFVGSAIGISILSKCEKTDHSDIEPEEDLDLNNCGK